MITRTVVFPMNPTDDQKDSLLQTSNLYTQAYTFCLEVAWDMANLSAVKVHQATYKKLKKSLGLKSQYLCSARNRAVETVKAMRGLEKKGKNNRFLGDPRWKEQERKVLFHISRLQSKGTKSAKRTLKKVSGRLRRFKKDCDYVVAKGLMSSFLPGDTIVQSFYSCSCGLKLNADLNASRNISTKWRMANGNALGLSVNQPIVADCN